MSKDPAFLFYPGDWLGGTMGMSFEIKGAYLELLIFQFNNYHFTEEQAKQVLSICFDVAWPMLKQKFEIEDKFYYQHRLREEIEKRRMFTESRRINGLMPKIKRIDNKAYAKHMENENENENKDLNNKKKVSKKFIPPSMDEVMQYFEENGYTIEAGTKAWHYYDTANWHDARGQPVKNWKQKMQAVWFKDENKTKISRMEEVKSW
jgi:hypothetical protein